MGIYNKKTTHIGKELKANCVEQMNDFFRILKEVRLKQKIIGEKDYKRIWNADETAIWLDLIRGTTIEKIGNKKVNVCAFGNEKKDWAYYCAQMQMEMNYLHW